MKIIIRESDELHQLILLRILNFLSYVFITQQNEILLKINPIHIKINAIKIMSIAEKA